MDYLLEIQILAFFFFFLYLWKQRRKERDNPCELFKTHRNFCVYVIWKQIFVYIRKEERNRKEVVDYS